MRKDTPHDPADADELVRLTEELERRNAALEAQVQEQDRNRVALLHLLEDLEREHKLVEQARREWTLAFDAIRDPVFVHDANYHIVRANRAYAERAGSNFADILGRPYWEVFPRGTGPLPRCRIATEGKQDSVTEEFTLDSGDIFVSRSFVIRDAKRHFLYAVHVLEDVTEQRQAEAERRTLSEALRQSAAGLILLNSDLSFRYANPAACDLVGYEPGQLDGKPIAAVVPEGMRERTPAIKSAVDTTGFWTGEVTLAARDGTLIPAYLSASTITDATGKSLAYVGSWLDLRPIKQAQAALAASEARFRLLTENASDLVSVVARDGRLLYTSQSVQRLLGYAPDETVGHDMAEFLHPDDIADARAKIAQGIAEPSVTQVMTHRLRHQDGSWRYFETQGRNLLDEPAVSGIVLNSRDITERKRVEQALAESEEKFRSISATALDAVLMIDTDGSLVYWNPAAERIFGYRSDEVLGKHAHSLLAPARYRADYLKGFEEFRKTGTGPVIGKTLELEALRKDGSEFPIELSVSALRLNDRWHAVGILRDATRRKRAEEALRDEKLFSDQAIESLPGVFYLFDTSGRFVRWNRNMEIVTGYTHEEIGRMHPTDLFTGADRQHIVERITEVFEKGESTAEAVFTTKDGRRLPFFFTGRRVELAGKIYLVGMGIDISARLQAEEALRESEEKFRALVETTTDWIWQVDEHGVYTYASPQVRDILGYAPEEIVGKTPFDLMLPSEAERMGEIFESIVANRKPFRLMENANFHKDGRIVVLETSGVPIVDRTGAYKGCRGIDRDITARKQAEEEVRKERDTAQRYLDIVGVMLVALDSSGKVSLINRKGCELLGYNEEEIVGQSWFDRFLPERLRRDTWNVFGLILAGEMRLAEFHENPVLTRSGAERVIAWHNRALTDETGKIVGTLSSGEDITERKQAEAALLRANRALKTLSACNATLVHAQSEPELLQQVCQIIVETGGYHYAWIGYPGHDEAKHIRLAAQAGFAPGVFENLPLTWADNEVGQIPAGIAIREGAAVIVRDVSADPALVPWRPVLTQLGVNALCAFPLMQDGEPFGTLSICSSERDAFDRDELMLLAEMAEDLNFGILTLRARVEHEQLQEEHLKTAERLKETLTDTIRAIALTVEKRDPYTAGHQNRVSDLCVAIGRELKLPEDRIEGLRLGATIHDIGKVYVPAEILNRPGKLTGAEFEIIKSHPEIGYEIVKDVKFPWPVAETVRQHHEHLDGSGYPRGLKGEAILLEARILAVADVIEAMAAHRPYRPAHGIEAGLEEIGRHRGDWYDPAVVDACLKLFHEKRFAFS